MTQGIFTVLLTIGMLQSALFDSLSLMLWEAVPGVKEGNVVLMLQSGTGNTLTGPGCYLFADKPLCRSDREISLGMYRITLDEHDRKGKNLAKMILYYEETPLRIYQFRYTRDIIHRPKLTAVDVYDGRSIFLYRQSVPARFSLNLPPDE